MKKYIQNPWNWVHFLGSSLLSITLYNKIASNVYSFIFVFLLGVLFEVVCEVLKYLEITYWWSDPKGWNIYDIFTNLFGIIFAFYLLGVI